MWRSFASVFAAVFLAEIGDKTQLATMLFAAQGQSSKWLVFAASASALVAIAPIAAADCQSLEFITEGLPTFYQGDSVSFQIQVYGGTPGYTFTITSGRLPSGLHLTSGGLIEGEPDGDPSDTTIFVRVTDSLGCQRTQAFAVRVEAP